MSPRRGVRSREAGTGLGPPGTELEASDTRSSGSSDTHLPEERESLWMLTASPAIWVAHFLLAYCTAAVWCAKAAGPDQPLGPVRVAIAAYTVVALAAIGVIAWRGWKRHAVRRADSPHDHAARRAGPPKGHAAGRAGPPEDLATGRAGLPHDHGPVDPPHDRTTGRADLPHHADTPEDRHRFLGFATVLLSGLSAVAVIYEALPAVFIGTCW